MASTEPEASTLSEAELPPDIIDMDIFGQLLEMDEEDDHEFSKSIVWNYFDQAKTTFEQMEKALEQEDLSELSTLGHFLKGSSAACGVIKVRDSCEYMQHYGKQKDEKALAELPRPVALHKLTETLRDVKVQYKEAEKALRRFYNDDEEQQQAAAALAGNEVSAQNAAKQQQPVHTAAASEPAPSLDDATAAASPKGPAIAATTAASS
ncbi:histidine-phosphotransfer domain, HPT domain-containing protein [Tilletiaria anomala UBC 951]|uniref:Histidine-phosphotransfer domain, HPT domain-containing protein n=1 Tax=Tilletiaria anomala (strain ATCC 24038 / CBS 436.72 / UBC 951) TaxID=1037660 RepID=A0A066WHP9_TILAU|nr:histidine-phosphotransfer domain, HPT domain-containing protein [Tilletiaria anomala UBC 951]KDN52048.1 histidine-phosphotransfer domain, HPT domain-containing protein [Tilletiaria anomala UBC 951]